MCGNVASNMLERVMRKALTASHPVSRNQREVILFLTGKKVSNFFIFACWSLIEFLPESEGTLWYSQVCYMHAVQYVGIWVLPA